jgi:hypothetical protein
MELDAELDNINTAVVQALRIVDPNYAFDYRKDFKTTLYTIKKDGVFVAQMIVQPINGLPMVFPFTNISDDLELRNEWLRYSKQFIMPYIRDQVSNLVQPPELSAGTGQRDSGHFNYSPKKRREIVKAFRTARDLGSVENRDAWAQSNYNITGKTLSNYEKEFDVET